MNTQLSVLNVRIRSFDGLYSLNDLHKVAGSERKHEPNLFFRLDQTQELVKEIQSENSDTQICVSYKSLRTGQNKGTWACEELVLAYATWISPKFHLVVLRAFLAMHKNEQLQNLQQPALPAPEKRFTVELTEYELQQLAWLWFAFKRGVGTFQHIEKAFNALGSNMSGKIYGQAYEYLSVLRTTNQTLNRLSVRNSSVLDQI
ncbi:bacteriocin [Aggregatibacter actinomycetemcomitans]|uniref:P22AR C-terminal domain-containing protein n=1 Tax=Aggregatibacter actinomycetemcomitans TaxID=714 RepID=UPI0011DB5FC1|nr:P22AR C-terminal domain-containing protein [Aggregatibacter actinomycetemcomitans]TYA25644.1 bacteriocin [Aggregatibacter actinomycetemcomitans]